MSLNITMDGYVYYEDGNLASDDVHFQMLWYPNGTASSPTTWNDVRTTEVTGYYNANLGDLDFLSQEGVALSGGKVVIVFWRGSTTDRNALCDELDEWGAFEVTLDGSDFYTNTAQTKTNIAPNLVWSLTNNGYVDTNYTATNTSYDVHNWTISGTQMYHWRTRYGEDIQLINTVSGSRYNWRDGGIDYTSGTTNASHQWSSAGSYEVELVIWDECSATVTGTDTINIYWHAPVPDIAMTPVSPDPNEPVAFYWDGTDIDDRITSIDWVINDSGVYGSTDTTTTSGRDDTVDHTAGIGTDWCGQDGNSGAFTNPGSHLIEITYHWNDGFSDHADTYSETFTQGTFSAPSVAFSQDPAQAVVGSGVVFNNETTNTSRVGFGLPDCDDYDWTFTDNGVVTEYLDKPFSYDLDVTPTSANCQVKLCAWYSDGWDTNQVCVEEDVVFGTYITVTSVECYYGLSIVGTSSDGSVTGYSWTVASGSSETGPWTTLWNSPTGIDQQEKTICFTSDGWYNITGYVHGNGLATSGDETLYVDEVCVASGTEYNELIVWNGTGALDEGGDWSHSGYGSEESYAKRTGTNGLDTGSILSGQIFKFISSSSVDVSDFNMLSMWVSVQKWAVSSNISVQFQGPSGWVGDPINLNAYIDTTIIGDWQRALIPFSDFNASITYVHELRFKSSGNMRFYLDDIILVVGATKYTPVPYGDYDVFSVELGISQTGHEPGIAVVGSQPDVPPPRPEIPDLRPSMKGSKNKPSLRPYPGPTNL